MTRSSSGKRGEKTGIHESGRRVKRKLDEVQKESSSKRQKSRSSVGKQSSKKVNSHCHRSLHPGHRLQYIGHRLPAVFRIITGHQFLGLSAVPRSLFLGLSQVTSF
ncbi:Hypothetical predicted protein [Olea europaea subsp. europaea]|uniref:Uncharacterized protein n=1 Tax=Olea europaea subsp. europaea TaxID=158383 RepID=A0A8S0SN19_OLEEU|nr:Hypothetical predicted protein [Olea europaea subsp. europaea]